MTKVYETEQAIMLDGTYFMFKCRSRLVPSRWLSSVGCLATKTPVRGKRVDLIGHSMVVFTGTVNDSPVSKMLYQQAG